MSALPGYVTRLARMPQILAYLQTHPDGMAMADLATEFDLAPERLHEDLIAFFMADAFSQDDTFLGLSGPAPLEFTNVEGAEIDPNDATWVRVVDPRPTEEMGAEYLDSAELGLVWTAAVALADLEQDADPHLASAIEVLTETLFEGVDGPTMAVRGDADAVRDLRRAIDERRLVRIRYSRAWEKGETTRVIAPYLLVETHRGWEVDAGAVEADLGLRTFLVHNIRELHVTEETFERPVDVDEQLQAQRITERVRLVLPHAARWAADMYAESVTVVEDDETTQTLDLELLPPAERRVGLMLLAAGEESRVIHPRGMMVAALETAATLLAHHRREPEA